MIALHRSATRSSFRNILRVSSLFIIHVPITSSVQHLFRPQYQKTVFENNVKNEPPKVNTNPPRIINRQFNYYIFILLFNVILFVIWNIPFFKYLCEISYGDQFFERIKHIEMLDQGIRLSSELDVHYSIDDEQQSHDVPVNYSYNFQIAGTDFSDAEKLEDQDDNIYKVYFKTSTSKSSIASFVPLQEYIYCTPNETNLVFFQCYNPTPHQITGLSIYLINPTEAAPFVNKLQCFCFEDLMLQPYEIINLPVLFMIDNEIKSKIQFDKKVITINYILFAK